MRQHQATISQQKSAPTPKLKSSKILRAGAQIVNRGSFLNPELQPAQAAMMSETLQLPPLQGSMQQVQKNQIQARSGSKRSSHNKENKVSPKRPPAYPCSSLRAYSQSVLMQSPPKCPSIKATGAKDHQKDMRTPQQVTTSKMSVNHFQH